jgi:hypothetical protein
MVNTQAAGERHCRDNHRGWAMNGSSGRAIVARLRLVARQAGQRGVRVFAQRGQCREPLGVMREWVMAHRRCGVADREPQPVRDSAAHGQARRAQCPGAAQGAAGGSVELVAQRCTGGVSGNGVANSVVESEASRVGGGLGALRFAGEQGTRGPGVFDFGFGVFDFGFGVSDGGAVLRCWLAQCRGDEQRGRAGALLPAPSCCLPRASAKTT